MLTRAAPGPTPEWIILALRKVYVFPWSVVKVRRRLVVCANASMRLHAVWAKSCIYSLFFFRWQYLKKAVAQTFQCRDCLQSVLRSPQQFHEVADLPFRYVIAYIPGKTQDFISWDGSHFQASFKHLAIVEEGYLVAENNYCGIQAFPDVVVYDHTLGGAGIYVSESPPSI